MSNSNLTVLDTLQVVFVWYSEGNVGRKTSAVSFSDDLAGELADANWLAIVRMTVGQNITYSSLYGNKVIINITLGFTVVSV